MRHFFNVFPNCKEKYLDAFVCALVWMIGYVMGVYWQDLLILMMMESFGVGANGAIDHVIQSMLRVLYV